MFTSRGVKLSEETTQDKIARFVFQRSFKRRECSHLNEIAITEYDGTECVGCAEEGTETVHLRMCLVCGYNGCCDSSKPKHARRHHEGTGHPLIRSVEPGENWVWCYIDKAYLTNVLNSPQG